MKNTLMLLIVGILCFAGCKTKEIQIVTPPVRIYVKTSEFNLVSEDKVHNTKYFEGFVTNTNNFKIDRTCIDFDTFDKGHYRMTESPYATIIGLKAGEVYKVKVVTYDVGVESVGIRYYSTFVQ